MVWITTIIGKESSAVHSRPYPNVAPVIEYVEIPDGSSSAHPVTRPGPKSAKNFSTGPSCGSGFRFGLQLNFTALPGPPTDQIRSNKAS